MSSNSIVHLYRKREREREIKIMKALKTKGSILKNKEKAALF